MDTLLVCIYKITCLYISESETRTEYIKPHNIVKTFPIFHVGSCRKNTYADLTGITFFFFYLMHQ